MKMAGVVFTAVSLNVANRGISGKIASGAGGSGVAASPGWGATVGMTMVGVSAGGIVAVGRSVAVGTAVSASSTIAVASGVSCASEQATTIHKASNKTRTLFHMMFSSSGQAELVQFSGSRFVKKTAVAPTSSLEISFFETC